MTVFDYSISVHEVLHTVGLIISIYANYVFKMWDSLLLLVCRYRSLLYRIKTSGLVRMTMALRSSYLAVCFRLAYRLPCCYELLRSLICSRSPYLILVDHAGIL